ncbi:hypothetical protein LTR10_008425 [Elasticomyces elasticus]|nr:hypothetical protein LTR10_008425 [Elasticomyces elasticus]KAK4967298.1 hypothetical protein LTR42_010647 [Elasticomyces elasticus]
MAEYGEKNGKGEPDVNIIEINSIESSPITRDTNHRAEGTPEEDQWAPGRSIPWVATVEIAIAVLCTIAAILVVTLSNGKRQGSWYIPPTKHTIRVTIEPKLLLSVLSSVVSLMLALALREGLTVSWWRRALIGGKIRDLERHWSTGNSVLQAALSGKRITYVAFGLLLVTATGIAESTLLQRSTSTKAHAVRAPTPFTMTSQLATKLPYTGWESTNGNVPVSLDPSFATVVRAWTSNAQINSSFMGCDDTCTSLVSGAGLAADCRTSVSKITIGQNAFNKTWPLAAGSYLYPKQWSRKYTVFETGFDLITPNNSIFFQDVQMTTLSSSAVTAGDEDCPRTITSKVCKLRPAIVKYPVSISNTTLSLDKAALSRGSLQVERYLTMNDSDPLYTSLGGIYLALSAVYTSQASLAWNNQFGDGYMFSSKGSLVDSYYYTGASTPLTTEYTCNATLADPTADLLSSINDLMFRVAITNSSASDRADIQAIPTGMLNYYQSSFLFLGIAVALVWLNILVILPLFWGWWSIGRKISLNPIEVAEAFNAPTLRKDAGHKDVGGLIDQVGDRAVVFRPTEHEVGTADGVRTFRSMKIVSPED